MSSANVEVLEQRRLMALSLASAPTPVTGAADAAMFDAAVAGDGGFIVAFVPNENTSELQAIRYSPTGEQMGSAMTLFSGKPVTGLSVAMDDSGDAVVAWSQADAQSDASLHFERISSDGVASAPVAVAGADFVFRQPSISMDSAGGFFLGWVRQEQPADPQSDAQFPVEVKVQAFDSGGASRAAPVTIATVGDSAVGVFNVNVAAKPDGSGAVFALTYVFEGASDDVKYGQVSTTALNGTAHSIKSDTETDDPNENNPDLAVNADGSFELAYTTYEGDTVAAGGSSLLIQRFSADVTLEGDPILVSPRSGGGTSFADSIIDTISIDALPDGGFIAAYAQLNVADTGPVFVQRFDASGAADSDGPLQVGARGAPVIGADAEGNAVVAIGNADLGFQARAHGNALNFARVSTGADFTSVENGVLSVTGTGGDDDISVAVSGSDVVVVTRNSDSRTFAAADVTAIRVDGFDGNDVIISDTALRCSLYGGAGKDTLIGGGGSDLLSAGGGKDLLVGNAGKDRLRGGDGRDRLYGGGGDDILSGGASGDWLYGQAGNDQLNGDGGNDRLYDDYADADTLHGNAGNDFLITRDNAIDQIFGDGGHDIATADSMDVLTSIEVTG